MLFLKKNMCASKKKNGYVMLFLKNKSLFIVYYTFPPPPPPTHTTKNIILTRTRSCVSFLCTRSELAARMFLVSSVCCVKIMRRNFDLNRYTGCVLCLCTSYIIIFWWSVLFPTFTMLRLNFKSSPPQKKKITKCGFVIIVFLLYQRNKI